MGRSAGDVRDRSCSDCVALGEHGGFLLFYCPNTRRRLLAHGHRSRARRSSRVPLLLAVEAVEGVPHALTLPAAEVPEYASLPRVSAMRPLKPNAQALRVAFDKAKERGLIPETYRAQAIAAAADRAGLPPQEWRQRKAMREVTWEMERVLTNLVLCSVGWTIYEGDERLAAIYQSGLALGRPEMPYLWDRCGHVIEPAGEPGRSAYLEALEAWERKAPEERLRLLAALRARAGVPEIELALVATEAAWAWISAFALAGPDTLEELLGGKCPPGGPVTVAREVADHLDRVVASQSGEARTLRLRARVARSLETNDASDLPRDRGQVMMALRMDPPSWGCLLFLLSLAEGEAAAFRREGSVAFADFVEPMTADLRRQIETALQDGEADLFEAHFFKCLYMQNLEALAGLEEKRRSLPDPPGARVAAAWISVHRALWRKRHPAGGS